MEKRSQKKYVFNRDSVKSVLQQALSPAFLLILLGSCLLWFATKLGYEYTTEMPLNLRIDGQKYRITAQVTGRGSTLLAQRLSLKSPLNLTLDELSSRSSRETPGALTITPASLQRAINGTINELVVKQIVNAPEFIPAPVTTESDDKDKVLQDTDNKVETPREKRRRERQEKRAAEAEAKARTEKESESGK
jgi:hypothetical protein